VRRERAGRRKSRTEATRETSTKAMASRAGETAACIQSARAERLDDSVPKRKCKHSSNVEFALFFYKLQAAAREREGSNANGQWVMALGKVAASVCKLPSRIRSLEHANAIQGVGEKTLVLFRKYLDAFPPEPPTEAELRADAMVGAWGLGTHLTTIFFGTLQSKHQTMHPAWSL
jgi:hypothetical protein